MAPTSNPPLLLFTDVDGTLLDHHNYRWDAAQEAVAAAREQQIPIILNTSKTFSECRHLQQELELEAPFIVENGAGIAVPEQQLPPPADAEHVEGFWVKSLAPRYPIVRNALEQLRAQGYRFRGFGDMSQDEVRELTNLSPEAAACAHRRQFSEPLVWQDTDERLAQFGEALAQHDLRYMRGGRFIHVVGAADKGKALKWLRDAYGVPRPRTVALGDSDNDLPMLRAADVAVLVRSPAHEAPLLPLDQRPPVYMATEEMGPAGWNRAVLEILKELVHG